jgi:hypothetical protein
MIVKDMTAGRSLGLGCACDIPLFGNRRKNHEKVEVSLE